MNTVRLIYILFLITFPAVAQTPYFRDYELLKKNEDAEVNALLQDDKGYIWTGTNKGLFRFDGERLLHFTKSNNLLNDKVTALAKDHSGKIWIGYDNGMLSWMEDEYIHSFAPDEGNATASITDILFDKKGNMWFSTAGDGLYCYRNNRLWRFDEQEQMPDLYIYDIAEDENGTIWAGTDGGAAICTLTGKSLKVKTLNYETGLPDNIIRKIVPAGNGIIWLATEDAGIIKYDQRSGAIAALMPSWKHGSVKTFLFCNEQMWIAGKGGLMAYDTNTGTTNIYDGSVSDKLSSVISLLADNEGNIWAGSAAGLTRTAGNYLTFIEQPSELMVNITALTKDAEGNIWFVNKEGLFKRTVSGNDAVVTKQLQQTPYEHYPFISLYADDKGGIWAGTYGEGVVYIGSSITCFKEQLTDGNVLNISGKDNEIWLATLGGATRIVMNGGKKEYYRYSRKDGLSSEYIYQVFTDSKQRTWFATDGMGICMMDKKGFHHYTEGLEAKVIYGFAEDKNGTVWANIQRSGISHFDGSRFIKSNLQLTDDNIHSMMADDKGNLILLNDLGIDIYNVSDKSIRFYGEQMGIRALEPNLNAVCRSGNEFLFGTANGIIIYNSENDHSHMHPVPVIDRLTISNRPALLLPNAVFSHDQNDLTINFLGFWYQNPEDLSYSYRLDHYDKKWITGKNRFATYSSLPPGSYTFRVKTSANENFAGSEEATFSFTIDPPFWQTTWFYLLSSTSMIIMVLAFIRYRERKLQHDNKVLEAKNEELKKINMELDRFVYSVSHDLRAPLLSMQGIVEITSDLTTEDVTKEHMQMLEASIGRLDRFISEILDYSRNARVEVRTDLISFNELVETVTSGLKHIHTDAHISIKTAIDDKKMFYCDRERLTVILNNLISNSIRYHNPAEAAPYVLVTISADEQKALIKVDDNGSGIRAEHQEKVFDMFYRASEQSTGSGLGLYIVKETVDKLNGRISLSSEYGKGTSFSIEIPNLFYQ